MKTGIITFHDTTNYGANLQAYALYKALADLGVDCEIINYQCENIIKRELPQINIHGTFRNFIGSILRYPRIAIKHKNLKKFMLKYESVSKKVYTKENITESNTEYSKFIVGSDILWNLNISENDFSYFLNFAEDTKKKFSYATSIGEPWTSEEKTKVKPYLLKFDKISVRENEAVAWVDELTNRKPNLVCDPTMLIAPNDWSKLAEKQKLKNYVLVYLPNEKCLADAKAYASSHKMKIVGLEFYDSIETFFSKIKYADCIFTGSYHGFLFSLYFHTNIMFYNFQDTSRMRFLSKKFGIENHDATNLNEIKEIPDIDWEKVDEIREGFRKSSLKYLQEVIEA